MTKIDGWFGTHAWRTEPRELRATQRKARPPGPFAYRWSRAGAGCRAALAAPASMSDRRRAQSHASAKGNRSLGCAFNPVERSELIDDW